MDCAAYQCIIVLLANSDIGNVKVEACKKIKSPTVPYISLTIKSIKSTLLIEIKNSSINDYQYSTDGQLITTKLANAEHHGIAGFAAHFLSEQSEKHYHQNHRKHIADKDICDRRGSSNDLLLEFRP